MTRQYCIIPALVLLFAALPSWGATTNTAPAITSPLLDPLPPPPPPKVILSREKPPPPLPLPAPAATNEAPPVAPARNVPIAAPSTNVPIVAAASTNECHWTGALQYDQPLDDMWNHGFGAEVRYVGAWESNWEWAATFGVGQWSANQSKNVLVHATRVYSAGLTGSATVIAPGVALTRLFPLNAVTTFFLEGALRYEFVEASVDIEFDYTAHHGEQEQVKSPFEPKDRPSGFLGAGVIRQFPPTCTAFAEIGYQADLSQSETDWLDNSIPCTFDAVVFAVGLRY